MLLRRCASAVPDRAARATRPPQEQNMSEEGMTEIDLGPAAEDPLSLLGAVRRAARDAGDAG